MKFVMSYSCGKDSTLALHRLIKAGHRPVALQHHEHPVYPCCNWLIMRLR